MSKYIKPVIVINDELSEGVYAASGEPECWTINVTSDQNDAGGYHTFRVACTHNVVGQHVSTGTTIVITFNQPVTAVEFEGFTASVSGSVATLKRETHGNAYGNGDNFNTLLKAWSSDCKSLAVINATISCDKALNVQGGGADEL